MRLVTLTTTLTVRVSFVRLAHGSSGLMSTFVRLAMSVGELRLLGTLPAFAARSLLRRVFGATIATSGCTRGAFAARTAATATTATSATTTATRLAVAFATLPIGAAICTLGVLAFSSRSDRRARVDAISDVVREAIRVSRAIYVAATIRLRRATRVSGPIAFTVVAPAVSIAIGVVPVHIASIALVTIAPSFATVLTAAALASAFATTSRPAIAIAMPATTAAAL